MGRHALQWRRSVGGIDVALSLTERVHDRDVAEALQLIIEYDPEPPFNSGSFEPSQPEDASAGETNHARGSAHARSNASTGGDGAGPSPPRRVTRA